MNLFVNTPTHYYSLVIHPSKQTTIRRYYLHIPAPYRLLGLVQDDSVVLLLEPLHSLLAGHLVGIAEVSASGLSLGHTTTRTGQLDVEIHTENTSVGVVLDSEINVLVDTESEVSRIGEVLLHELVLLHLQTALQNLQSLLTTDGDVHGDLLVTADGESTDGETGYASSTPIQ